MAHEDEFTEYVGRCWPRLVRSAILLGCTPPEAEDVCQTALTRCLVNWARVRRAADRDAYVHRVLINTLHGESDYGEVTDSEIRAGATVHLSVGDGIWAYSKAEKGPRLEAEIRGTSLVDNSQPGGPNQGRTWKAVESGATQITLSVVVEGRSYEIGTVRVIVD